MGASFQGLAMRSRHLTNCWSSKMKVFRGKSVFLVLVLIGLFARAQAPESYGKLLTLQVRSGKLSPPQHIADYEKDGKLTISLEDAVRLALENNSSIRIQETQVEAQKFVLLGAHQPFDPLLQTIANASRYSTPTSSE